MVTGMSSYEKWLWVSIVIGVSMIAGNRFAGFATDGPVWWTGAGSWLLAFAVAGYRFDSLRWALAEREEEA